MYVKIIGCICVILAASGYGYSRGLEYQRHVEELGNLSYIIRQLAGEISYTRAPLAEICGRMKTRVRDPYRTWLGNLAYKLERPGSVNLAFLWSEMAEENLKALPLAKEEMEELKNLGGQMGCLDIHMQEEVLLRYAKRLEEEQKRLQSGLAEKRRLCNTLGVTGGLLLVVLLL